VKRLAEIALVPLALLLGGCVVLPPSGPSMMALPGSRMPFEQFRFDDAACRQFATAQVGGQGAGEAAQQSAAASTVAGTALGAAAGAAFGGSSEAAAVGAGIGLLTGAMIGMGASEASYHEVQRRYDIAYYQCMYGRGHRVPVFSRYTETARPAAQLRAPATPVFTPPPDAGIPPPDAPPPPPPATPYVPPHWPRIPPPDAPPPR